ncbi:MAG: HlyD family efflux transporter periplasmic adaptor subunit, partial [Clostridiales bacterium]|nr:HlyD family efflux transporter periplasmic adaptor subunit [Clostridiales bacterium]
MSVKTKKKSKKKIVSGVIIVILVGIVLIPKLFKTGNSNYIEITPEKGDITTYYSFSGSVEAKNRLSVLADRIIQIKNIKVEVGQTVEKDDVLIETSTGGKIKSKIDGEISNIYVEENAQVMSGGKLMDIVDY